MLKTIATVAAICVALLAAPGVEAKGKGKKASAGKVHNWPSKAPAKGVK